MPTMVTGLITTLYQVSTLPSFHFPNHVSGVVLHLCHSLVSRPASGGGKPGHVHRIHDLFIFTACPGEMFLSYAKSLQSCLTPCNPMDCSSPGSSVHGILQARILEWVAVPSSRRSSQPRDQTRVSRLLHWKAGSLPRASPGQPLWFITLFYQITFITEHYTEV